MKRFYIVQFVIRVSANPWFVEFEGRSWYYQGHQGITETGLVCQRWDAQTPESHDYTDPKYFPDATIEEAGNYCRRMDGEWPWCYTTTGGRWDYCGKLDLLCTSSK